MREGKPDRQESLEVDFSQKLFEESQKLWTAYRDLTPLEIIRKRAEDIWNRIDQACVKIHNGETVSVVDIEDLINESKRIRKTIEHKNY